MSDQLLFLLKLCLLALLYLFFFRVLRAVWAELRAPAVPAGAAPAAVPAPGIPAKPPVPVPPAPAAPPPGPTRHLVVVEPASRAGEQFALGSLGPEITIGRASGCQVSAPEDSFVSQVHARVFSRQGEWCVEDMGSTNGTFVNEQQVAGPTTIRGGDRLRVGGTVLEVR